MISPAQAYARMIQKRRAMAQAAMLAGNRRPSPFPVSARPQLEEVIQPLYDTEAITAGSGQTLFFGRPLGQAAVSGFPKTLRDTNLRMANALGNPQVFVATGIRVIPSQINGDTLANPTAFAIPAMTSYIPTLHAIVHESVFSLTVGTKEYVSQPTVNFPGLVGVDAIGCAQRTGSAAEAQEVDFYYSLWPDGEYHTLMPTRIRIPPLQTFSAAITFPVASKNAVIANGIKVTVVLDGVYGREVQ